MPNEIALYGAQSIRDRMDYAATLAKAGAMIPRGLWDPAGPGPDGQVVPTHPSPAKIFLVLETGSALGLSPTVALQSIDVIEGRAEVKPRTALALLRQNHHSYEIVKEGSIETGDYKVTVRITRGDDGQVFDGEYSLRDAERARLCVITLDERTGLFYPRARSKDDNPLNWEKSPKEMTLWRAAGRAIREGAPEVLMAAPYIEGEILHDDGPADVEATLDPTEDWEGLIAGEAAVDGVKAILDRAREKGELTDKIRTIALAHMGAIRAEDTSGEDVTVDA